MTTMTAKTTIMKDPKTIYIFWGATSIFLGGVYFSNAIICTLNEVKFECLKCDKQHCNPMVLIYIQQVN